MLMWAFHHTTYHVFFLEMLNSLCSPTSATRISGMCNQILTLMLKVYKNFLYDCKGIYDLKITFN